MTTNNSKQGLSSFALKIIALVTMTIDHVGLLLLDYPSTAYTIARNIGRIAFPTYCFLLVEGFFHTSSKKTYLYRLSLFALISEIPFDMALFHFPQVTSLSILMGHQNVFITLALAFFSLCIMEKYRYHKPAFGLFLAICIAFFAEILHTDYGLIGVMVVCLFYYYKTNLAYCPSPLIATLFPVLPLLAYGNYWVLLCIPFLLLYDGRKGREFPGMKYLFYAYYPLHLLVLCGIRYLQ